MRPLVDVRLLDDVPPSDKEEAFSDASAELSPQAVARLRARQAMLYAASAEELVDTVTSYLRATENVRLVSAEEEHALFPVLLDRLQELRVEQLLDVAAGPYARSTLVRYGALLNDLIRDRIAAIATAAAASARHMQTTTGVNEEESGPVYAEEAAALAAAKAQDPVLADALAEMNAANTLRCILVMGMSGGRRKRDLPFFQALGIFFVHHINAYKDPHDLVRVLTAFARAKIVPPKSFVAVISRRLPVLSKRQPLEPLPCYRAMSNYSRAGFDQMNGYRFLADCMCERMAERLTEEKRQRRLAELRAAAASADATSTVAGRAASPAVLAQQSAATAALAKERLRHITGLKPSMFTRWLYVLARFGAPHQQYLRPFTDTLIAPMLPFFPPPSFSRLLAAVDRFRSTDVELLEALTTYMVKELGPQGRLVRNDVLLLLTILAREDTPVPANVDDFLRVSCEAFLDAATPCPTVATTLSLAEEVGQQLQQQQRQSTSDFVLRPTDMCRVATVLRHLQAKPEIPLEATAPFAPLMDQLAVRFLELLDLGVVSLRHVDAFLDACQHQQHPDATGVVQRLVAQRCRVEDAASVDEVSQDGDYSSRLDIDVRETFHKIQALNDSNVYHGYRPLPGPMQVDFRAALVEVSALDLLEAVDLFARVCPGALRPAPALLLSRSLLAKLGGNGEEVQVDERYLELRPPRALLLTKEDLTRFTALLARTPLERVRTAPAAWAFVREKAQRLRVEEVQWAAERALAQLTAEDVTKREVEYDAGA